MPITPLPPLDRTSATFKTEVDTFFATLLPKFSTDINQLATQVDTSAATSTTKASEAAASAATASTKAGEAATSATTATTKASEAATNATTANTRATTATNAANTATTKAGEASTSASNAAGSATSAGNSATTATTKANEASASATTATNKAGEASTSATNAATKASEAAASATASANSANSADTRATSASNSATTATTKANEASNSATTATTKANEAAASASNALTQANRAQAAADSIASGPVTSVNGKTGAPVLNKADIGLPLVDNSSDVNKPVSTAQAAAIAKVVSDQQAVNVSNAAAIAKAAQAQAVGDILITADSNQMQMPWVPANGGIRSASSLPTLAAALGKLGGQIGITFSSVGIEQTSSDITSAPGPLGTARFMSITATGAIAYSPTGAFFSFLARGSLPGTNNSASNSIFYDETTDSWIALCPTGTTSFMFVSSDNGVTWTARTVPVAFTRIATDSTGVWIATPLAGGTVVYRSADFGVTWASVSTGTTTAVHNAISTDGKGVFCVAANGSIRRSFDFGATWSNATIASTLNFSSISNNKNGVWLAGINGTAAAGNVFRSSDNGLSWAVLAMPASANVFDIAYTFGTFFLVRSTSPQTITISDQPDAVTYNIPASGNLSGTSKVTATNGYAISTNTQGYAALAFVPTFGYDQATQFQLPDFPVARGLRAWIKAATGRYATADFSLVGPIGVTSLEVGFDGVSTVMVVTSTAILRSVNKGASWATVKSEPAGTLTHVAHLGGQNWFACGNEAASGRQSSDGGTTWTNVAIGSATVLKRKITAGAAGVCTVDFSAGFSPMISRDYGKTWAAIPFSAPRHHSATDGAGNWILVGTDSNEATLVSRDNGSTWSSATAPASNSSVTAVVMFTDGSIFVCTSNSTGHKYSTDFGATWVARSTGEGGSSMGGALGLICTGPGRAMGKNGNSTAVVHTTNYGRNWTVSGSYSTPRLAGRPDTEVVLAAGSNLFLSSMAWA